MPLGWRPRGLPAHEPIVEITPANQQKYRTSVFPHARPYLVIHLALGIVLMLQVIKPTSNWTTIERWIGALMLWHTIINWSGILESKPWVFISENIRIVYSTLAVIMFCGFGIASPILYVFVVLALGSLAWGWKYFRIK